MMTELMSCRFRFMGSPSFGGYTDGSTWNGFPGIFVTESVRADICRHFGEQYPDDLDMKITTGEMMSLPVFGGLVSLCGGWATELVED